MNQKGRRMEGRLQNEIWTLGAISYVLQPHKLTQHISSNDERHLQRHY
jgi:hypothetical protein